MSEPLHLEGYSLPLQKQKIYCVGDVIILDKLFQSLYLTYKEEVLRKHKIVVVFSDMYLKHIPKWLNNVSCDAVFRIRDSMDYRLVSTYIQHTVKPLLLFWYANDTPTSLLQSKDDITLITGGKNINIKDEYTTIIWDNKSLYQEVYPILFSKFGSKTTDIKSILQECLVSSVFLSWSCIGDSDKKGSLYWYDVVKPVVPTIDYKQASEYLKSLAEVLETF